MAEAEVNYASVVFKSNKNPPAKAKKEEETVYDEVKGQSKLSQQTSDSNGKKEETVYAEVKGQHKTSERSADTKAGFLPDKKDEKSGRPQCLWLACCLGILCVILLVSVIGIILYLALMQECDVSELNQLKGNQTTLLEVKVNLTNHNKQLSSENEKLNSNYSNLQAQYDNLTQAYTVLERNISNLTAQNQELESQRKNLTEQIRDMKTKWKEDNVTRAQWSIDAYCSKIINNGRQCNACQSGWINNQSGCYVIHNAKGSDQKTWEEARENCTGKSSDLAVLFTEGEKKFTTDNSWNEAGISGYWIGLKVEDGRWKWVDGRNLTNNSWIGPPVNGTCVISFQGQGWRSVSCDTKNAWICKKKALSV